MSIRLYIVVLLLMTGGVFAQIRIGTIGGRITDQNGAVVAGAGVRLSASINGESLSVVTDATGGFIFNNVTFNRYTLKVEAPGFNTLTRTVTVNSNLPLELAISLSVVGTSEQVEIQSSGELIDADSPSSSITLTAGIIQRAPRINRGRQLPPI